MQRTSAFGILFAFVGLLSFASAQQPSTVPPSSDELWIDPVDLERRDLFRGPSAGPPPPATDGQFAFVAKDTSGRSPGYDVRDGNGTGLERQARPRGAGRSRRVATPLGHRLPSTADLLPPCLDADGPGGRAQGRWPIPSRDRRMESRRRLGLDRLSTHPIAVQRRTARRPDDAQQLGSQDVEQQSDRTDRQQPARRASTSRAISARRSAPTSKRSGCAGPTCASSQGSKNDLPGFEESGFIDGVEDGYVKFSYSGPNKPIVSAIQPSHVVWTATLLSRLSDEQWHDAFRAGGYSREDAARYIAKFKEKIAAGLALETR